MARTNFLVVMADQMTPFAAAAYGGPAFTPHLDSLCERGVRFDAAYCNSTLCAPARFAFMSGQYISKIAAWDNAAYFPSTVPTFAHYLRRMGYRTSLSGKMHFVGPDQLHGFEDRVTTDIYPADFGWVPDWTRSDDRIDLWYHNMSSVKQAGPAAITNQLSYDDEVGALSMRWLYDAARSTDDRPFCHVASFIHPHDPYAAHVKDWALYEDVEIDLPRVPRPRPAENDPFSLRLEKAIAVDAVDVSDADVRRARRAYYANITYVDRWLGRLMEVLEETGRADDTAIVFLSDHGDMLGERGLWYKMSLFEPSARIPMVMAGPGLRQGVCETTAVSQVDVLPTLLDLSSDGTADGPPEIIEPLSGTSLAGPVDSERTVAVEYTAEAVSAPMLMLRNKSLKYITCPGDPDQLFDLAADPLELENKAEDPAFSDAMMQFRDFAADHWDTDAVHQAVLQSQRTRRLLTDALEQGRRQSWDFQPVRNAADEFTRSHMELSDFDSKARWPRPAPFTPRWR